MIKQQWSSQRCFFGGQHYETTLWRSTCVKNHTIHHQECLTTAKKEQVQVPNLTIQNLHKIFLLKTIFEWYFLPQQKMEWVSGTAVNVLFSLDSARKKTEAHFLQDKATNTLNPHRQGRCFLWHWEVPLEIAKQLVHSHFGPWQQHKDSTLCSNECLDDSCELGP